MDEQNTGFRVKMTLILLIPIVLPDVSGLIRHPSKDIIIRNYSRK